MKGFKQCLFYGALFVLSLTGSLVLSSTDANAQSVYDDILIEQTYPFNLESPYNSSTMAVNSKSEISNIFANAHFESSYSCTVEEFIRIYGLTSDSPYIVTSNYQNSGKKSIYLLVFNQEPVYNWSPDGLQFLKQDYHRIILNSHSSTQATAIECSTYYDDWGAGMIYGDKSYTADRVIEYGNFVFDYPSGYAGQIIQPTSSARNDQPDIYMSSMENFKGTFSDRNFLTFDGIPFTCGEFVPQINVELWSGHGGDDEELLEFISTTASSQFDYTFPTLLETSPYRIVSWYSCPEYEFTNISFYDFEINAGGGLVHATPCVAELFCSLNLPTHGLTQVILSPLAFLSKIPDSTCSALVLPLPNNIGNIGLPCMTPIYQQYFGTILLMFQTIITGLFAYYVSLRIFGNVKDLTNPRDDQIETVRL